MVILMPIENESLQVFKSALIVANLWDLRSRITAAVALVNRDISDTGVGRNGLSHRCLPY
jgi:hypothetical protein